MSGEEDLDYALLSVVLTALLIRLGGRAIIDGDEWDRAVARASSVYLTREQVGADVAVVLMPKREERVS